MPSHRSPRVPALLLVTTLLLAACGDGTGPDGGSARTVTGSWAGSALLPNGFSASMTLEQSGSGVTGDMRIAGVFTTRPLTGSVDDATRTFTFQVLKDCEVWSGALQIASGGDEMSGPLLIDRTGCVPAQDNGAGTLSVTR